MDEGYFSTHIRLMRKTYRERYEALLKTGQELSGIIDIQPTSSGFHTVGFLDKGIDENKMAEAARRKNVFISPLNRYCLAPIRQKGLVLGYGCTTPNEITRGIKVLKKLTQ